MSSALHYCCLVVLLLLAPQMQRTEGLSDYSTVSSLLPDNFPTGGNYTVRYVSERGTDNSTCLESQPYPLTSEPNVVVVTYCQTLRYALFGHNEYQNDVAVSNLIVLLEPGSYPYGNVSIVLMNFTNLVISKVPNSTGEAVLFCQEYLERNFNNIYITYSNYVAINDVVVERCGPLTPGMGVLSVNWLTVSNCIAR